MDRNKEIIAVSQLAQSLIDQLYSQNPEDETFYQSGMICVLEVVEDYLHHNEPNIAIEHLLYVIYESNISFPPEQLELLHQIVKEYGVATSYY